MSKTSPSPQSSQSQSSLFRVEALEAQKSQWLGGIVLMRPLSFAVVAWVSLGLASLLAVLLVFGEYTKRARVMGVLTPERGVIKVVPPQLGVITQRFVTEGQTVAAGDKLFTLSLDRALSDGSQASQSASAAVPNTPQFATAAILQSVQERRASLIAERSQQQLQSAQIKNQLAESLNAGDTELRQLRREIATQTARVDSVQGQLAKFASLAEQKFVSDMALQQKRDELLDQQSRLQGLERALTERQRALTNLRHELEQVKVKGERERSAIDRGLIELDQSRISTEAAREIVITAPAAGKVASLQADIGQVVSNANAHQPLLAILPEGAQLQAQLFAPSAAVGFVSAGQPVRIRFAAYPYQKFGQHFGQVIAVTRVPFGAQELPANLGQSVMAAAQMGEGLYRITVALNEQSITAYGKPQALSAGMQLEADVLQETRSLLEWVFEPLFSIKGRL